MRIGTEFLGNKKPSIQDTMKFFNYSLEITPDNQIGRPIAVKGATEQTIYQRADRATPMVVSTSEGSCYIKGFFMFYQPLTSALI